ncbi:putative sphingolipid C4-monooxygenase [Rosa chinensis]|uniref:Putative sphingolipid C4-monooxygenase n=1 Tax=Rosa chinensis TaxID=74649 RepID=A0A2P6P811_ROSCH|nr:sphinganine C4-monooxygenase 2 isoform X1 [Rosa chinensis]PRQ18065.1 putative sphingolipid C4-monooxygenase [Rosa chinensis]
MGFMRIVASDEVLGTFIPIIVYWLYAALIVFMEKSFPKYKIRSAEEQDKRNHLVSKGTVIKGVVLQQVLQALTATLVYILTNRDDDAAASMTTSTTGQNDDGDDGIGSMIMMLATTMVQFLIAMVVMDTWQYFMHRYMHENKFLYKHIHSQHHRLVAPYAYAALYNHPLEGLLVDTMSGAVSFLLSGMSPRTSIFFFSFATIKAVDDHSGVCNFPWHPFHVMFRNNSLYHDVHHQLSGTKFNFSQPFFVFWDRLLGTYHMPSSAEDELNKEAKSK